MRARPPTVMIARMFLPRLVFFVVLAAPLWGRAAPAPWDTRFMTAPPAEVLAAAKAAPSLSLPPDTPIVVLLEERVRVFEADGRSRDRLRRVFMVLSSAGARGWAQVRAVWAPWNQQRPELRARVISPTGEVRLLDPRTIEESGARSGDPLLYSDRRILRAPLPGLEPGAVVEYEAVTSYTGTVLPDSGVSELWYVGDAVPTQTSRLILDLPAGQALHLAERPRPFARETRAQQNGRLRVTVEAGPLGPQPVPEPLGPSDIPPLPVIAYSTAPSWAELARGYGTLVDRQLGGDTTLLGLAREAVGREKDPSQVATRLLAAMRRKVRYTGIEFAEAAVVPRSPTEVLARGYGDCKDQATFLVGLLRSLGFTAHVALLLAGNEYDVDPALPGMDRFNHAIVYLGGAKPLWIDPTDEYSPVGQLPSGDEGRLALIAAPMTTSLVRIPRATADTNQIREMRTVTLAEMGPATVVERFEAWGETARRLRAEHDGAQPDKIKELFSSYVRAQYQAKQLASVQTSSPRELTGPFRIEMEAAQAALGSTSESEARFVIRNGAVLEPLPRVLREMAAKDTDDTQANDGLRTTDLELPQAYQYEVRHRVIAPHGFAADPLPPERDEMWGPAHFTVRFNRQSDGVVEAVARLSITKTRWSPSETQALRKAVAAFAMANAPVVTFRQIGQAALDGGRVREALMAFRRLDRDHPRQALHQTQIARSLLAAGLGDAARRAARTATALDPKSALGWRTLGHIASHDTLGQRFAPGADLAAAEAAYRQALLQDDADHEARWSLAVLLWHDAAGLSYPAARLPESLLLWERLSKDEASNAHHQAFTYQLFTLLKLGRFDDILQRSQAVKLDTLGHAIVLAAMALRRGQTTALAEADRQIRDASVRREALRIAGNELMFLRDYAQAAALLGEAARGHEDAAGLRKLADRLRRVKRRETVPFDPKNTEAVARRFLSGYVYWLRTPRGEPPRELREVAAPELIKQLAPSPNLWGVSDDNDVSPEVVADLAQTNPWTVSGDATLGFRAIFTNESGQKGAVFLALRPEGLRVVATDDASTLSQEVVRLGRAGNLDAARQWLRWEAEEASTADMLRSWLRTGPVTDLEDVERAASLVLAGVEPGWTLPVLEGCQKRSLLPERRSLCSYAAIQGAVRAGQIEQALAILADTDNRDVAWYASTKLQVLLRAGRLADARAFIEPLAQRNPDDGELRRLMAETWFHTGALSQAQSLYERFVATDARAGDFNQLAWLRHVRGENGPQVLEQARRAAELSKRSDDAILNTLAVAAAESGEPEEAREAFLEAIHRRPTRPLDDGDHYALALIALAYGERDEAMAQLHQIAPPGPAESAASVNGLAYKRRQALTAGR